MLNRIINLPDNQSFFLFGPRQTGKSTLIKHRAAGHCWRIDLLLSESFFAYSKSPEQFRKEAEYKIEHQNISCIFVDEVQRIPQLLNEIHYLIEKYPLCQFIMSGSSARKLKRGGVNLLAGRAVQRNLYPFVVEELQDRFDLESALIYGTLPPLLDKNDSEKSDILNAYVHTYLREEIQSEGLSRNLGGFSRFLDVAAFQSGQLLNYSAIGRDCALPTRTVQSYFDILEDTLVGFRLMPWRKSLRKRLTGHAKFYFFDTGVVNALNGMLTRQQPPLLLGRLFEHFIVLETNRMLDYRNSNAKIFYWRTNHNAEVDLLIEKYGKIVAAIEIKYSKNISSAQLSGLRSFMDENPHVPCYVVANIDNPFDIQNISVLPWKYYLETIIPSI